MLARLQAAEASFRGMGLPETARVLLSARMQLALDSSIPKRQIIREIESALSAVGEPVEQTLELFALHAMCADGP